MRQAPWMTLAGEWPTGDAPSECPGNIEGLLEGFLFLDLLSLILVCFLDSLFFFVLSVYSNCFHLSSHVFINPSSFLPLPLPPLLTRTTQDGTRRQVRLLRRPPPCVQPGPLCGHPPHCRVHPLDVKKEEEKKKMQKRKRKSEYAY